MREIKFRAYTKEGFKLEGCNSNIFQWIDEGQDVTIEQFTGLKDKNGVDIYEGDIYHQGDKDIRYKVIFKNGGFIGNQVGNKSLCGIIHWIEYIEVIGNIHEKTK